ncbi:unnamed protein product [Amoebophrya sp. A120]|nr:unnamed protein product [Amoebophrya sp. A120]|eukprot:GSA120T00009650001.1
MAHNPGSFHSALWRQVAATSSRLRTGTSKRTTTQNAIMLASFCATLLPLLAEGLLHTVSKKSAEVEMEAPTSMFRKETMPAVPTTVIVIINLTVQYFLVYAMLAFSRTFNAMYPGNPSLLGFQKLMESCTFVCNYCPMLCVLYLGARMRAEQIAQGKTEELNLPSPLTRFGMQLGANCVLGQLLCVLVLPLLTGSCSVPVDGEGNLDLQRCVLAPDILRDYVRQASLTYAATWDSLFCFAGFDYDTEHEFSKYFCRLGVSKAVLALLTTLRYFLLAGVYGGAIVVVYGIHTMDIADEAIKNQMWPDDTFPKVSPPVQATIFLSSLFFVLYSALALLRTYMDFFGANNVAEKLGGCLSLATFTVNMAPMLCILFIGARMRALQMDPVTGKLPEYAQYACYGCSGAILLQAALIILLPYTAPQVQCVRGDFEGDVKFVGLRGLLATVFQTLRYFALFAVYGGFSAVCYAIFTMKPAGADDSFAPPPLSPAMLCVMNLVAQYFFIYLSLFVTQTIRMYKPDIRLLNVFAQAVENARMTVMYAPMLAVLFVVCRMRALQLARTTSNTIPANAGPPTYAQECMYLATWSVLAQILLVLVMSFSYPIELDEDGNVKVPKTSNLTVAYLISALRYGSLIAMHGGSCGIVYALIYMTPETIQPYAHNPILPPSVGVEVPAPVSPESTAAVADILANSVSNFFGRSIRQGQAVTHELKRCNCWQRSLACIE